MSLNRFNTTPTSHPSLYNNGMYTGGCKPMSPGQSVTPAECAKVLAVAAVGYGWSVGDVALQVARTMQRKMGVAIFPDEEQAHGVAACAFAAEVRRRIASKCSDNELLKLYNIAVENEMPYSRYGYDGENSRSGGALFSVFFGASGNYIYSEFAAVNGDLFGSMVQKIRGLTSNMLSRVSSGTTTQKIVNTKQPTNKPRIIQCPNCGKDVSSDSKTCWCCDAPISQESTNQTNGGAIDRILNEVSVDYDAYVRIPNELTHEYSFLLKHQSHEFALQVALTMLMYAVMKFIAETKRKDEYMQQSLRNIYFFASTKYDGGKQMLQDIAQYQGDYVKKCVDEGSGQPMIPYHLNESEAEAVVRSCEKTCFPYIHCLVTSTFDDEYPGNSANFFRHFIGRAENRYAVYRPLLEEYYQALKEGGEMAKKVADENVNSSPATDKPIQGQVKSDHHSSDTKQAEAKNKQGCLSPLVLLIGSLLTLTGLAATLLY